MIIRNMEAADVEHVIILEESIFSMPWHREDFIYGIENPDTQYLVAEENDTVIAYCGYCKVSGEGQIYNVAVSHEHRNRRVGFHMLKYLIEDGEKQGINAYTLEVRVSNESAIRLYHSLGFEDAGIRKKFYSKPSEDAIIMWYHTSPCRKKG